jgi:hypothetical protein
MAVSAIRLRRHAGSTIRATIVERQVGHCAETAALPRHFSPHSRHCQSSRGADMLGAYMNLRAVTPRELQATARGSAADLTTHHPSSHPNAANEHGRRTPELDV